MTESAAAPRPGPAARLRALPTQAQDTLLVLAVAAMSVAPLLPRLPAWAGLFSLALLLWRGSLAWRSRPLPSRLLLAGLLAAAVAAVLLRYHSVAGRDPGVCLVCMLLALKLLEVRRRRDAYVVFYLGLFCVFAQFLYAQSAPAAAWMLACTLGWLTALIDANLPGRRPPLARRLGLGLRLIGLGLPVMAALFLLFPRLSGPLWSLPDDARARTGLASDMDPGAIARLALDDSVAFNVRFLGRRPPQSAMYWRGPVLGAFDGRRWSALPPYPRGRGASPPTLHGLGEPVRYTVTLQPTQRHFAFALDAPASAPALSGQPGTQLRLSHDLELRSNHALSQVTRYTLDSWLRHDGEQPEPAARLRAYTRLPAGDDPRTVALGRELARREAAGGPRAVAAAALRMFREQPFRYSLHPGTYTGPDAIDQFLFQRRVGFCEHYAQAFVVLMRAAGIPARVVTGYQGGSENPVDGLWVVRQSDAHAWAEYWVAGSGWLRADPTAMVDPSRIDRSGQTLDAAEPLLGLAMLGPRDATALRWLRNLGDAVDQSWNDWVLEYGQTRQRRLLRELGLASTDPARLGGDAALSLGLLLALGGAWLLWRGRPRRDPWQRAYALLCARLRRAGVDAPPTQAPAALARGLGPDPRLQGLRALLMELELARYAPSGADARTLRRLAWRAARVPIPRRADRAGEALRNGEALRTSRADHDAGDTMRRDSS